MHFDIVKAVQIPRQTKNKPIYRCIDHWSRSHMHKRSAFQLNVRVSLISKIQLKFDVAFHSVEMNSEREVYVSRKIVYLIYEFMNMLELMRK